MVDDSLTVMLWIERRTFLRGQLQTRPRVCRKPTHFRRRSGTLRGSEKDDRSPPPHLTIASQALAWRSSQGSFRVSVVVSLIVWVFTSCLYCKCGVICEKGKEGANADGAVGGRRECQ